MKAPRQEKFWVVSANGIRLIIGLWGFSVTFVAAALMVISSVFSFLHDQRMAALLGGVGAALVFCSAVANLVAAILLTVAYYLNKEPGPSSSNVILRERNGEKT